MADTSFLAKSKGKQSMSENKFRLYRKKPVMVRARRVEHTEYIDTAEGTMRADPGDWLIIGVKGEYYPCKPDVFALTYELAEKEGDV